jgi:ubiquinone/menaquinone biosynthesis C-methylase UbiE
MIKEKNQFSSVLRKYSEKKTVDFFVEQAIAGLQDWEDEMIGRYVKKGSLILSVGCGVGREPIALSTYSHEIIGIDIVHEMLQKGYHLVKEMNVRQVHFAEMNAVFLGFQNDTFDAALLTNQVLALIPKKANRLLVLREIFRVLKPGGTAIVTTPSIKSHLKYKMYFAFANPLMRFASLLKIFSLEPGDRYFFKQGPNLNTPTRAFIHMYTLNEGIKDLKAAGFDLMNIRSRKEWLNSSNKKRIEKDYVLAFIAYKPKKENDSEMAKARTTSIKLAGGSIP